MQHQFDSLTEEVRRRKIEQMLLQHHVDIQRLLKRIMQRPLEWYGLPPHAADAFSGATGALTLPTPLLGKTDAAHNKGASGTISIYSGTPGAETDTGENVTAFNKFADLESGKWVWVELYGLNYYLTAGEC